MHYVFCAEIEHLLSITKLFGGSEWPEREVWESFGVFFKNHPNLHHLLLNYGFSGFPLRKSFPLSGYKEYIYTETINKIANWNTQLVQELRDVEYPSVWDEKPKSNI